VSDLKKMWARLEQHQSFADERGYGDAWKTMCKERTPEAAKAAAYSAEVVGADAAWAEWAARVVQVVSATGTATSAAEVAEQMAAYVINRINKAERI